ncbi:MAG: DUF2892 domain-containing protein [Cellvibrio sp.]|jgi:hypothetical protein|nr:DUF2892 domain-containing protein [Cellvibrio sp.]
MSIKAILATKNVAVWDRILRALPALIVGWAWYTGLVDGGLAITLAVLAVMLFVTTLTGACSLYYMLGWSTCPISRRTKHDNL